MFMFLVKQILSNLLNVRRIRYSGETKNLNRHSLFHQIITVGAPQEKSIILPYNVESQNLPSSFSGGEQYRIMSLEAQKKRRIVTSKEQNYLFTEDSMSDMLTDSRVEKVENAKEHSKLHP